MPIDAAPVAPAAGSAGRTRHPRRRAARLDERGEGVISTAIAVLIIAFLGVAMWVGFQAIFDDATTRTGEKSLALREK